MSFKVIVYRAGKVYETYTFTGNIERDYKIALDLAKRRAKQFSKDGYAVIENAYGKRIWHSMGRVVNV